tara:strand:- start:62504 stop:63496 length:993 start_codon:yes stop_codon:yes gene_type:complete
MSNKNIAIVTGGAGFIGSHMVDLLLSKGYEVRVVDNFSGGHRKNLDQHSNNRNLHIFEKSINDINRDDSIFKNAFKVFHFAGKGDIVPSIEDPEAYFKTNVYGTLKVLEACRYSKISKFIYAASSSCYGIAKTPTDENAKIEPLYPYALSKYQGEQMALHWGNLYNLSVISIRIFNAYGIRVRTTGAYGAVFGVFFKQKLENKPFTVVGDGDQSRDFIYVTDVAKAFYSASISNYKNQIYNLGAGNPQTINHLINIIGGEKISLPKRPGEPDCTWANIDKIKKHLSWKPEISFEKGVKYMINDINSWNDAPLWDVKSIEKATKTWFTYIK